MEKNDIVKSNALIEAVYRPGNVYQMRLLMAALMQVKSKTEIDFRTRYCVSANALADMTGAKAKNNYQELKSAADTLMSVTVTVFDDAQGKPLKKYKKINLVSSCEYEDGAGTVGLRFTEEIVPYISSLKTRFTQYQARYVMPMTSGYSIRLYELCLQWLGNEREFTVEEFRRILDLKDKYDRLERLKAKVITPAIKEINKYSDIHVTFGQRKSGRRVTHFQFKIAKKQGEEVQEALPLKKESKKIYTKADLDKDNALARAGETYEQALKRLNSNRN